MKPDQYISARLLPILDYYQDRLPRKYCIHKLTSFLAILATSSIAVLSFLNQIPMSGVVGGVATGLAAWQAESGTDRKINRCESLPPVVSPKEFLEIHYLSRLCGLVTVRHVMTDRQQRDHGAQESHHVVGLADSSGQELAKEHQPVGNGRRRNQTE